MDIGIVKCDGLCVYYGNPADSRIKAYEDVPLKKFKFSYLIRTFTLKKALGEMYNVPPHKIYLDYENEEKKDSLVSNIEDVTFRYKNHGKINFIGQAKVSISKEIKSKLLKNNFVNRWMIILLANKYDYGSLVHRIPKEVLIMIMKENEKIEYCGNDCVYRKGHISQNNCYRCNFPIRENSQTKYICDHNEKEQQLCFWCHRWLKKYCKCLKIIKKQ